MPESRAQPRVLHFIRRWLPLSEPFVYDLVTKSRYSGPVVAICPFENSELFTYEPLLSLDWLKRRKVLGRRQKATTLALIYIARRHGVRLVHVHHGYGADDAVGVCRRLGLPMVLSLHGHDITGGVDSGVYERLMPVLAALIVPSRFLAEVAAARGFPDERIHVIPSGVDTTVFTPTPLPTERRDVLFVGRFVEKKGLDVLLAAWPSIRREFPDSRLRILGFGPLEDLVRSGGDGVEVVLHPDHRTVRDAMRTSYVVTTPSRTAADDDAVESLLVVNLEAQATGRPVVTTNHGGVPEFVADGKTAIVVPENDPQALAGALSSVLRDPERARQMAAAGPEWVEQFDARRSAERVDALYASLLAGRPPH